jgi:hypothetical protein
MRLMRKRFRVLLLAAIVAAIIVPVGFALSLEPVGGATYHASSNAPAAMMVTTIPLDGGAVDGWFARFPTVPDPVKLVIIGTSFFGLAAIVRKAS